MYNLQTDLTNATMADFYGLLFGQAAEIRTKVASLSNIFSKLASKYELMRDKFGAFMAEVAERPETVVPSEFETQLLAFQNADSTEIAYVPVSRVAQAVKSAINSNTEPDLDTEIEILLDNNEKIFTTIGEAANKISGMTDCMILQAASFKATLADTYSDACYVLDEAMDRVSQYSVSSLLQPVHSLKDFYQTHWNSGTHNLVLFAASMFGLDRNEATVTSLLGNPEINVWAGITGLSAFANMAAGLGSFFAVIGNFVWKVVSTLVEIVFKVLKFITNAIISLVKWVFKKWDDFIFKSTVGTGIISTSKGYGWSSTYTKRFIIPANTYVAWYMYTHDYLDNDGYTFTMLNVRLNIKYKSNGEISKTVSWQNWYNNTEQYQIVLVGSLSVSPLYGPALFNYCRRLGSQGMFDLCSSNVNLGKSSQDEVQNSDYNNDNMSSWNISKTEIEVLIDCFNQFDVQTMIPEANLDTRDVAEAFMYGHGLANIILACPFKDIVFNENVNFDANSLPNSVKQWCCLILKQLFYWGCTYVSGNAGFVNCLSEGYNYQHVPNYGAYRNNSTLTVGWHGKYWACVPFDNFNLLINYLGDISTSGEDTGSTLGSNKWFAKVVSQARAIDTKSTSDQINTYSDTYTLSDNWRDGMLSYEIYGTVNSALFRSLNDDGVNYSSFFGGISTMVLNSWNLDYPGTFIPGSPDPTTNSDMPYYILTDMEEQATVTAYTSIIATKVIIAAVIVVIVAIGIKLFKSWRSAKFVADTAAFNYGDAVARGDATAAANHLKTYKKAHLIDSVLGFFSPAKVAGAASAMAGSVNLSGAGTAGKASAIVKDDVGDKIDEVKHLIIG